MKTDVVIYVCMYMFSVTKKRAHRNVSTKICLWRKHDFDIIIRESICESEKIWYCGIYFNNKKQCKAIWTKVEIHNSVYYNYIYIYIY